jgi:nicotinamidase/pyrazinamidase
MKSALIVVDMQKDFMPGGALSVPSGDEIIPLINKLMTMFPLVVATKDFHPKRHVSFASSHPGRKIGDKVMVMGKEQELWPEHCVQGSPGAEYDQKIDRTYIHHFIEKGTNKDIDSYSTFFDNAHNLSTGLGEFLQKEGVKKVFLCGVATEYCVLYSSLDALKLRFEVFVILDACKGINVNAGDVDKAVQKMKDAGVCLTTTNEVSSFI